MKTFPLVIIQLIVVISSPNLSRTVLGDTTTWKYAKYCDPDPTYELNRTIVEHMFREMHRDKDFMNMRWEEAEKMTPSRLEKICHQLLVDITPADRDLKERYHYSKCDGESFEYTRKIKDALVVSEDYPSQRYRLTILKCVWREMDQWIIQGNSSHVFRVDRNPDNTYEFRTGLHPVNFNVK